MAFTPTVALAVALAAGFVVARSRRSRILQLLPAVVGAYALAAVFTAPLIVYLLLGYQHTAIASPRAHPADLLNLVVPTHLTWLSWGWTDQISASFWGSDTEQGAYLGLPTIAVVLWYVWAKRRTERARFLAAVLLICVVAELGLILTCAASGPVAALGSGRAAAPLRQRAPRPPLDVRQPRRSRRGRVVGVVDDGATVAAHRASPPGDRCDPAKHLESRLAPDAPGAGVLRRPHVSELPHAERDRPTVAAAALDARDGLAGGERLRVPDGGRLHQPEDAGGHSGAEIHPPSCGPPTGPEATRSRSCATRERKA